MNIRMTLIVCALSLVVPVVAQEKPVSEPTLQWTQAPSELLSVRALSHITITKAAQTKTIVIADELDPEICWKGRCAALSTLLAEEKK